MQEEPAQERVDGQRHQHLLVAARGVAPAEGDLAIAEGDKPMVGDRRALGVCTEIAQCVFRPAEGALGVDDPVLAEQSAQPCAKGARFGDMLAGAVEVAIARWEGGLQAGAELAAKDAAALAAVNMNPPSAGCPLSSWPPTNYVGYHQLSPRMMKEGALMSRMHLSFRCLICAFTLLLACIHAPDIWAVDASAVSTERIFFTASIDGADYRLEAMLYYPQDGRKVHPLVVLTHGRNGPNPSPNPRQAEGYRPLSNVLAEHGYEVMMLVRRGYGNSQGPDSEFLDSAEESGLAGAKDVEAAVSFMCTRSDIDCDHIVIIGQSQGGWVSLAASTIPMKGVLGAVNISGAVNFRQGAGLGIRSRAVEDSLKHSASAYGRNAKVPTLWIYAENDNHLPDAVRSWFEAYIRSGGRGRLVIKPAYKDNGHAIVTEPALYIDDIFSFFKEIGFQ